MRKKVLMVAFSAALVASLILVGCAPEKAPSEEGVPGTHEEKPTYHWRAASNDPEGQDTVQSLYAFSEDVLQASDGRIVIDVYHSGVLGDWVAVQEEVMRGTIELSLTCLTGKWDPRLEAPLLPYLVSTHEEVAKGFQPGSKLLEVFDKCADDTNLRLVCGWDMGFNGFAFSKLPPNYGDVDADKNCKMRIAASHMREIMAKRFGYTPVVLPWADCFQAMQTGLVDGVIGGPINSSYEHFRDVMTDWVQMNEVYQAYFYIMPRDLWNSLSDEDRGIIQDCANKQSTLSFTRGKERDEEYLQKMVDYGVNVIYLTPEELAGYVAATQNDIWPELGDRYGAAVMDAIRAYVGEIRGA